ncbi:MAG TPA: hypothetical protein PKX46_03245 [Clostridia bacterium]|nr:hypothetical protein [Clostridia bacterium]
MDLPKRKKIRLEGYDYSSCGAYFVTICVTNKNALLWNVGADTIRPHNPHTVGADTIRPQPQHTVGADTIRPQPPLSQYGKIVDTAINQIPSHYENVVIDKYCIMPDHIHMIVFIMPNKDERRTSAPTLPTIIGSMKRWVAKNIGFQIWQKSFNDHIIRNEQAYQEVWKYIDENPMKLDFPGG